MPNIAGIDENDKDFIEDFKRLTPKELKDRYGFKISGGAIEATIHPKGKLIKSDTFFKLRGSLNAKAEEIWDLIKEEEQKKKNQN